MPNNQAKRILVAEDSKDLQSLLTDLLIRAGYKVDCVANGQEALEFLKSTKSLPGLILLDLVMPEMDGYQFRQAQEEDARTASIPVVIMTADDDIQSKAMKIGAKGFLKEPFPDVPTILNTIGRFFPSNGSNA